jgi:hypothetical protein
MYITNHEINRDILKRNTVPYRQIEGLQLGVDGLYHLKKTLLLVCLRLRHLQLQTNQIIVLYFYKSLLTYPVLY